MPLAVPHFPAASTRESCASYRTTGRSTRGCQQARGHHGTRRHATGMLEHAHCVCQGPPHESAAEQSRV
eukprot:270328-Rhodomonas_salina.7